MSIYGHVYAVLYDPFFFWAERSGTSDRRAKLLADVRGRVLEIGAGTGLNLPHYRDAVDELVLLEPEKPLLGRLDRRLRASGLPGRVVQADAERLPFEDASFDAVVSTFVLCTVGEPLAVVREIRRVLAPDGRLFFLEHVRAPEGSRLARWQDRLHDPWRAFAYGCQCNLETLELLRRESFAVSDLQRAEWRRMPPIVRPLVWGRAVVH